MKPGARKFALLIVLGALMITGSSAHSAPPLAAPPAVAAASPTTAVNGAPEDAPPTAAASSAQSAAELAREIQVQLMRIVPAEMRIDDVTLGCKPPPGAVLKSVAPGLTSLTSRSFMVELTAHDRDGDHTSFCSAAMNASRRVLVATRDLTTDAAVSESDFVPSWIDAFTTAPGVLASFPGAGPYLSATLMRAGQPLYENSLKLPIAVHPGDLVTVMVSNGPVTVRTQLQAQSQAVVGDTATMINPGSGLRVSVTVTGPRRAQVLMQ